MLTLATSEAESQGKKGSPNQARGSNQDWWGTRKPLEGGCPQGTGSLARCRRGIDHSLCSARTRPGVGRLGPALPSVNTQSACCWNACFRSFLESQQRLPSLAKCHSSSRLHILAGDSWHPAGVRWLPGEGRCWATAVLGPRRQVPPSLISWGPLSVPSLDTLPTCPP